MSIKAIECPDGVCHSHHGGHAVPRQAMQKNLEKHGKDWCEKLAERIYEMSVDTYSQTVMPSLHSAGWQRRHLDWEFKLAENGSEPDEALVEGIINATESFLRSSEVHRLFIQELVQGTFEEANDKKIISKAIKSIIEEEIVSSLREKKETLLKKISAKLISEEKVSEELAINSAKEGFEEVERLLANHSEAGGYAKAVTPEFLSKQKATLTKYLSEADVAICTAQVLGKKAPVLIDSPMIEKMRPGAVVIDLAVSQGGNCEGTKSNETIIKDGVKLIGAGELPSSVPYDASSLYAKNLTSLITPFIKDGVIKLDKEDELISGCLLSDEGVVLQNKVFEN